MSGYEKPAYLVAIGGQWLTVGEQDEVEYVVSFATIENARAFAKEAAEEEKLPLSLYRIVKYEFSGEVIEA